MDTPVKSSEVETCELIVLCSHGDKKEIWNPRIPDEVESAKKTFEDLRRKGYLAFRVNADGSQGEQINTFDPEAGKMIMVPQMRGG